MSAAVYDRLARRAEAALVLTSYEAALGAAARSAGVDVEAARARIDPNDVRHRKGGAEAVSAVRRQALYLSCVHFSRPQKALSRALGVAQSLICRVVRDIEGLREDGGFDRRLDEIELELMEGAP